MILSAPFFFVGYNQKTIILIMFNPYTALSSVEEDLHAKGIPLVEYGDILEARFGYPVCVQVRLFHLILLPTDY